MLRNPGSYCSKTTTSFNKETLKSTLNPRLWSQLRLCKSGMTAVPSVSGQVTGWQECVAVSRSPWRGCVVSADNIRRKNNGLAVPICEEITQETKGFPKHGCCYSIYHRVNLEETLKRVSLVDRKFLLERHCII